MIKYSISSGDMQSSVELRSKEFPISATNVRGEALTIILRTLGKLFEVSSGHEAE
jgi:hypothetical protein